MLTRAREEKGKEGTVDRFIYIVNYTPLPKKIISAIGSKFVIAALTDPHISYTRIIENREGTRT